MIFTAPCLAFADTTSCYMLGSSMQCTTYSSDWQSEKSTSCYTIGNSIQCNSYGNTGNNYDPSQYQKNAGAANQATTQYLQNTQDLRTLYGASAFFACFPSGCDSLSISMLDAEACYLQTKSCLETKAMQQTPLTCPSGSSNYKGTCMTYDEVCLQKFGLNSIYTFTDSAGKLNCDCKPSFTSSQDRLSCVPITTNSISQVAGAQSSIPNSGAHPIGTNVKAPEGTIRLVAADGTFRPYTSAGAFLSYGFNTWEKVVDRNFADMLLPVGTFIPPRDGTIFCATQTKGTDVKGECALITGGQKASFTSSAVFTGLGFSFNRAQYGDSSFLAKTANIDDVSAAHRPGVLVNNNNTVQLVGASGMLGIPTDVSIFNSWGYSFADVVPANSADKSLTQVGIIQTRQPGQLAPQ